MSNYDQWHAGYPATLGARSPGPSTLGRKPRPGGGSVAIPVLVYIVVGFLNGWYYRVFLEDKGYPNPLLTVSAVLCLLLLVGLLVVIWWKLMAASASARGIVFFGILWVFGWDIYAIAPNLTRIGDTATQIGLTIYLVAKIISILLLLMRAIRGDGGGSLLTEAGPSAFGMAGALCFLAAAISPSVLFIFLLSLVPLFYQRRRDVFCYLAPAAGIVYLVLTKALGWWHFDGWFFPSGRAEVIAESLLGAPYLENGLRILELVVMVVLLLAALILMLNRNTAAQRAPLGMGMAGSPGYPGQLGMGSRTVPGGGRLPLGYRPGQPGHGVNQYGQQVGSQYPGDDYYGHAGAASSRSMLGRAPQAPPGQYPPDDGYYPQDYPDQGYSAQPGDSYGAQGHGGQPGEQYGYDQGYPGQVPRQHGGYPDDYRQYPPQSSSGQNPPAGYR